MQIEHVRAERNLLSEVNSPCVVKLYYSFQVSALPPHPPKRPLHTLVSADGFNKN